MSEYEIGKSAGRCFGCQCELPADQPFHSAVFEQSAGFDRRDFCAACWQGSPAGAFCHFRTRLPAREPRRRLLVDDAILLEFFQRLGEHPNDPVKRDFRFVLMLILLRKRVLRYDRTLREADGEHWQVRLVRDGTLHRVLNPQLDDERIALLSGELGAVLAGHEADGVPEDPGESSLPESAYA